MEYLKITNSDGYIEVAKVSEFVMPPRERWRPYEFLQNILEYCYCWGRHLRTKYDSPNNMVVETNFIKSIEKINAKEYFELRRIKQHYIERMMDLNFIVNNMLKNIKLVKK